ncbi:hypothetical protein B6D12_04845 [Gilliamella apicola]|uniref:hypothetical protein n=1 Tax=Gilliamella apicola TaxID=1196095 RepID=UPI000A3427B5|nr:hypothetical protein [Gilliamella apicola]OTP89779.1 hypothetical protein B5S41_05875 [Gilliamella apicola]OTP94832.1 hypothetical protein B6D13_06290 [Gilliamella apicola]OTP96710.1 hypothetical protein B6D05_03610 [Gilliamella apicola]OTQ02571.1 hypothetical protein B6D07_04565 [Gilliamella apicola]OTQ06132.1 hypothetical protein B6D12_04845 [Gilliamella apicola]
MKTWQRVLAWFLGGCLIVGAFWFFTQTSLSDGDNQIDKDKKALISEFNSNKDNIFSQINQLITEEKYDEAISLVSKYQVTEDEALLKLKDQVQAELTKTNTQKQITDLSNELSATPESELQKRFDLYSKLLELVPGNSEYKTKHDELQTILERQQIISAQFSGEDGAHRKLEKLIKFKIKDVSTYKHLETKYVENDDNTLTITTTFYGKKSNSGKITKNTVTAIVDSNGNPIRIVSWK